METFVTRTGTAIRTSIVGIAFAAWGLGGHATPVEPPADDALLVLSKGELTMSVVDPATLNVVGRAPSGPDPHEIVASADGKTAFIANYNGGDNIISVVDLGTLKPMPAIDLGALRAPHGLMFMGGKVWFTAEGSKVFGSYDPATSKVDSVVGTGQNGTHMIWLSRDSQRVITTNLGSATVTLGERTQPGAGRGRGGQPGWNLSVIPVGRGAEGFDVSPDGKEIWTANAQDGTVSIIDVATKAVTATLQANVNGANRLKFTPDGKRVLISTLSGPDLIVLDAASHETVKRLPIGRGAAGIEVQPDGRRAYVACTPDDYVAVIDLSTLTVTGKINAGRQPDGLAWVSRGSAQAKPPAQARVALTFDDLPAHSALPPGMTRVDIAKSIIGALRARNAPPTYGFINAKQLETKPEDMDVLRLWRASGNPLGNHTFSHMDLHANTVDSFERDVVANEAVLSSLMDNQDWHWFRYPYLREGDTPEKYRAVRAMLAKRGYRIAQVTLSFDDYAYNEPYARCLARNDSESINWLKQSYADRAVQSLIRGQEDARKSFGRDVNHVMLLHIGGFETVMLPRLLEILEERGFALTTLEEAEADKAYDTVPERQGAWNGTLLEQLRPPQAAAPPPSDNVFTKLSAVCRGSE
jgi:YVTN family beta-propeller protein